MTVPPMSAVEVAPLIDFLLARVAEDEAAARKAIDFPYSIRSTPWGGTFEVVADSLDSRADHWLCVDPAHVLAECAAKRAIVAAADPEYGFGRVTLRILAAVYSEHEDFRQEWVIGADDA